MIDPMLDCAAAPLVTWTLIATHYLALALGAALGLLTGALLAANRDADADAPEELDRHVQPPPRPAAHRRDAARRP